MGIAVAVILLIQLINVGAFHQYGQNHRTVTALNCKTGSLNIGSTFSSPESVSAMMRDVAEAIVAARDAQVSLALVDVPIPVTGKIINCLLSNMISHRYNRYRDGFSASSQFLPCEIH